ncbi:hypothetical protein SPI_00217 [Niveomyces insectorum RCEF 264]|uniref:Uncharacterized protein n=1 Tax=Niveomyces insectorum RCEF 264 TaxID=1081102 RepID=A0A162JF74_9HYPO|nr:hypothetical protein SPI_00217 [Niveomyces insectorum RCEF 264]
MFNVKKSKVRYNGKEIRASRKLLPIARLHGNHRDILLNALSNVLDSPAARTTYGQILDGVPLSDEVGDVYEGEVVCPGHPLLDEHLELSADVLAKLDELRASTPLDDFQVDATTIFEYQAASPGSRAFQTRLIELVARTVHAIAIWIFNNYSPLRPKDDRLLTWRPDKDGSERIRKYFYRNGYPPTLFVHPWYKAYDQYPDGLADGVGYWAEDRIFGGVVLFDRRPQEGPDTIYRTSFPYDPVHLPKRADAIYFHTNANGVTYRIYRLRDEQRQQLLQFLLSTAATSASPITPSAVPSESFPTPCPLPIRGDEDNRVRIDPEESVFDRGVYRDPWEHKPLVDGDTDHRWRDVQDTFNFVSEEEYHDAFQRAVQLRKRYYDEEVDEELLARVAEENERRMEEKYREDQNTDLS